MNRLKCIYNRVGFCTFTSLHLFTETIRSFTLHNFTDLYTNLRCNRNVKLYVTFTESLQGFTLHHLYAHLRSFKSEA